MKRFLIFICSLLVIVALAIAAIPFLLTADFVGDKLKETVAAQTGRTLELKGGLKFRLWPNIMVEAKQASLSNPPGMATGQFAVIDTLRVNVAVMPLLSRQVDIREITLVGPRLSLLVDQKGRENWSFGKAADRQASGNNTGDEAGSNLVDGVRLAPIVITKGDVRFLDERSGSTFAAENVNITIKVGGANGPVEAKGNLVWNKQKVSVASFLKSPTTLTGRGSAMDLALNSALLSMQFNGRAKIEKGLGLAGTLNVETPSIRKLAAWTGNRLAPGRGLGAFKAKAALDLGGKSIKLNKARIALDGMNAQGTATISLAGTRPALTAVLGMDRVDVNAYLDKPPAGKSGKTGTSDWSDAPIDLSGLKAIDARVAIATSQIRYQDMTIGATRLSAVLKNGRLEAKLAKMAFYDGNAAGHLILNGRSKTASLQASLNASGLDGLRLLKDFAGFKRISGKLQTQISVAASGGSQRQLVSRLHGKAAFKFTNGAIRGINIAAMVRNVQKSILGGWDKSDNRDTDFSQLSASFVIKDGVASNKDLKMLGPLVRLSGEGDIDLLRRRLDLKVKPKGVASLEGQGGTAQLKGITVPIIVKGPWAKPKIYPDIDGILKDPKAAFNKLNKLLDGKTGVDLKKTGKKLKQKALDTVSDAVGTKIDDEQVKKGKKLLKSLFKKPKKTTP